MTNDWKPLHHMLESMWRGSNYATLHNKNSNMLDRGGGETRGYPRSVRMVLDRGGGGSADPQKSVMYYLNAPHDVPANLLATNKQFGCLYRSRQVASSRKIWYN